MICDYLTYYLAIVFTDYNVSINSRKNNRVNRQYEIVEIGIKWRIRWSVDLLNRHICIFLNEFN